MKTRTRQIVFIKWQDATTHSNTWSDNAEFDKSGFKICYAAGFLGEDGEKVKVALLNSEDNKWSDWIVLSPDDILEQKVIGTVEIEVNDD